MVPAASHRIPRVPWYLRTPLEDQSTFAYRAVTAYGGPFQGPSASGWFGNFDAIRQDGLRLGQIPPPHGRRPFTGASFSCFPFSRPPSRNGLFSSASLKVLLRPVPSPRPLASSPCCRSRL